MGSLLLLVCSSLSDLLVLVAVSKLLSIIIYPW